MRSTFTRFSIPIVPSLALMRLQLRNNPSNCEIQQPQQAKQSRIIFLGTGSSTGCPRPLCTMLFRSESNHLNELKKELARHCRTSIEAIRSKDDDPRHNKNYRNNPSLLITTNQGQHNVIIDVGKTFREGALRWFPVHNIASVDAILLTHHHMDAAGGLDDVRGFQSLKNAGRLMQGNTRPEAVPMPLYTSAVCLEDLRDRFPWLLPRTIRSNNSNKRFVERHVATFDVRVFEPFQPFEVVEGLTITPLPVMHGEDLVSYGFAFNIGSTSIVYISDISRMLPETLEYIRRKLPPIDILVVDALLIDKAIPVHFGLKEAVELAQTLSPKQTYLVGMNCDSFLPHDDMNQVLRNKYGNIALAYDGLAIDC